VRILVIEDSDSIRHMIETLVATRGHTVTAVPTGAKGIDAALASVPDAILLDLHLPGSFDGFDVCEKLRANEATKACRSSSSARCPTKRRSSARSKKARTRFTPSRSVRRRS